MEKTEIQKMWDILVERKIATEETLQVVTSINGYNEESLKDVLYVTTGLTDFDQLED